MKQFLKRIVLYFFPLILYFIVPITVLFVSRENFRQPHFGAMDQQLVGYAYNQQNIRFLKWKHLQSNQYNILSLGSSRVLPFRGEMFENSFFNAGFTVTHISDYKNFLLEIPEENYPKILILGLDQWEFNKDFENTKTRNWEDKFSIKPNKEVYFSIWSDLFANRYSFTDIFKKSASNKIGLSAVIKNNGFRLDGSSLYGNRIDQLLANDSTVKDFQFQDTYHHIEQGNSRFSHFKQIKENAFHEIDSLLSFCAKQNIFVVGFLPPLPEGVNNKMHKSGNFTAIDSIMPSLNPLFQKYHYELYDFTRPSAFSSNDTEFIDGFHGGELAYLKLLIEMLNKDSRLKEVADISKLSAAATKANNNYSAFKD